MEGIYLDHASSMPVDPRVINFAKPFLAEAGNPSSLYEFGQTAKQAVEEARRKVVDLINAESEKTIVFTGSATEANNLGIRGTAFRNIKEGKEVLASTIEHISVINPMKDLVKNGWSFNQVPVDKFGVVDLDGLKKMITKNTVVVSIMYANNEICLLYTSPSPRDRQKSRMPSSA